ncbi:hypothetical protein EI42_04505 [Thermosporothrix hazakensis]|jgi:hypothetical protein|uniref:Uncharacterized protein n=2 Tax=Thermosporothrix TaxID=768650 RepID=A0A326U2G9_THEHA|nr:hypothetical protein [Thermosporothrix hazakensis]PZW24897.1 hypothetical protein EI42_04505 [Thermosporothrix hazakensis]BBH88231.1 hypothetical protein KTC_29820 [Thermosporothrix sp. COM3]GCE46416.1 hypothetical protein KTH_12850 [Thermosporothrix hazakensis]
MSEEQKPQQNNPLSNSIDAARDVAEEKINQVIDQFAAKVPGGEQFKEQAKNMAAQGLDLLEDQAEQQLQAKAQDLLGNLGNMFGGKKEEKQ